MKIHIATMIINQIEKVASPGEIYDEVKFGNSQPAKTVDCCVEHCIHGIA